MKMHPAIRILSTLCLCLPLAVSAVSLDEFTWHNRLLFLIAPDPDDPMVIQQRQRLSARDDALKDREVHVFQLYQQGPNLSGDKTLSSSEARQLRRELGVGREAKTLILIGKDGTVKRRAPLDTDFREIFLQIDAMPMRRNEMQEKLDAGLSVTPP